MSGVPSPGVPLAIAADLRQVNLLDGAGHRGDERRDQRRHHLAHGRGERRHIHRGGLRVADHPKLLERKHEDRQQKREEGKALRKA